MLKSLIYLFLFVLGIGATLSSTLWGGVTVILAYMLNPLVVARDIPLLRYQFYTSVAFIISVMINPRSQLRPVSPDALVFKFLWCYFAVCVVSSLWATNTAWAFDHAFNFGKSILIAWLFTKIVHDERGMRILFLAGLIGALHAATMHTFGVDWNWVSEKFADEWGVLPDMQAPVMLLFLPGFVLAAMYGRNGYEKLLGWVGLPIVMNSIIESYQRAYFVGLVTEAVCLMLFLPRRIALRLAPVVCIGAALFVFVLTPENYWTWMDTINSPTEEGSASSRFALYKSSGEMLKDHPFGVGYRCYIHEAYRYVPRELLDSDTGKKAAHSSICTVACETGVLGFAFWAASFAVGLWLMRKIRKASDRVRPSPLDLLAMAMEIGLYGWIAGGLFHSDHEIDVAYWFLAFTVIIHRIRFAPDNGTSDHFQDSSRIDEPLTFELDRVDPDRDRRLQPSV